MVDYTDFFDRAYPLVAMFAREKDMKIEQMETARAQLLQLRDMVSSLQGTIGQLQTTIDQQNQMLSEMREENRELKRLLFGKSRERMPPVKSEIKKRRRKKKGDAEYRRRQARKKRRENAAQKKTLPTVEVPHESVGVRDWFVAPLDGDASAKAPGGYVTVTMSNVAVRSTPA